MRGDEYAALVGFQHHFQQPLGIKTEDGASVGGDVTDGRELGGQLVRAVERRHKYEVVDLADRAVLFIDGADFRLNEKKRIADPLGPGETGDFLFNGRGFPHAVKAGVFVIDEVPPQFVAPCRMGKVPGGHDGKPFDHAPCRKIADIQPAAGGAGKTRVDMEVCTKMFHGGNLA